ncbi:MAG: zinc-binding dehydrogenase, partial [Clostridiaceae bacterium]|nr:zinc-binding dehydrogenase [Clostridiaceae bacterium]
PNDVATTPIILGHEFCGELIKVGEKWQSQFKSGQKFSIQPAINHKGSLAAPGYSYQNIGGSATYVIIPNEVMEEACLLPYNGESFFHGSLSEPMSCIVGTFHANYHTSAGSYVHKMGIKPNGKAVILAGCGPMGIGAIDYAIHCDLKPSMLVVTDIDDDRIQRCSKILSSEEAKKSGVDLQYVNTKSVDNSRDYLLSLTNNEGYDDVFVFAPVKELVELADSILARDGCLNFFAGPTDQNFSANFNFYNVHYNSTHIVGTSGGNNSDMIESLKMMEQGTINPAAMVTHIGGLNAVIDTTLNLPKIHGGKKLIYTHIDMPLTAISDFEKLGDTDPVFKELSAIVAKNNGIWSTEAEKYLLGVIE